MFLRQLLDHIKSKALEIKNVHSFSTNDVYETYNGTDIKYSNITFSLLRSERGDNVMSYTFMVYYADRLLMFGKDNNKLEIQEQGISVILSLLNSLDDDITYTLPINFVPFEQQFADYLAGVYAEITLEVPYALGDCLLTDFDELSRTISISENGTYNVTSYEVADVNVDYTEKIEELTIQRNVKKQYLEEELANEIEAFYGNY